MNSWLICTPNCIALLPTPTTHGESLGGLISGSRQHAGIGWIDFYGILAPFKVTLKDHREGIFLKGRNSHRSLSLA